MALRYVVHDRWNGTWHSHMTTHYKRLCLEYLRQSIMCNADTHIEDRVVSEKRLQGDPGLGRQGLPEF